MFAASEAEESDEDEELLNRCLLDADGDVLEQGDGGAAAGRKGKGKSTQKAQQKQSSASRQKKKDVGRRLV